MTQLKGATIIVTGASSGIGQLVALKAAQHGANVMLAARSADDLASVQRQIEALGACAHIHPTDVTSDEQVHALIEATRTSFGSIDVLVNCAGYGNFDDLIATPMQHMENMIDINYLGTIRCMKAVLPLMLQQGRGHIVNIASVAGLVATPRISGYSASKFAVVAATKALQVELYGTPIVCSLVCPGPVDTPFFEHADYSKFNPFANLFGMLDADDVANIIIDVIRKGSIIRTIPRAFYVLALIADVFPSLTRRVLAWTDRLR